MGKYVNSRDEVFEAVQYVADQPLPKGVYLETVNESEDNNPLLVEKAFIATKDTEGDSNIKAAVSSVADGVWILTNEDGEVSLAQPRNRFRHHYTIKWQSEKEYKENN